MTNTATHHHADQASFEHEMRRYTPEEVVEKRLMPYRSVRVLRRKAYDRLIHAHIDGKKITFTQDDLRKNAQMGEVQPIA